MSNLNSSYKAVFPGKYIQGEDLISELPNLTNSFGSRGLIISSRTVFQTILSPQIENYHKNNIRIDVFNGECSESEINRLQTLVLSNEINVVVGIGGGKAIDTAKIVADKTNVPVIIVPTIASTDAPCSGCAVIYKDDGEFQSVYYQKMNPQVVLVDMNIIAKAPPRFLVAGMGDALATWFEARSCQQTKSPNACGGFSLMVGFAIAKLCYDTITKYGELAKIASENNIITPALYKVVEANILLSGIGFESSGLATAHSIHNGLSALNQTHSFYHGEKVAFGVLTGLHLNDSPIEEMESVYLFCEKIGLPTTLAGIGLGNIDIKSLMKVAVKSCEQQESIHHEAGVITPEKVLNSIIAVDAMGKSRKK